MISVVIPVFQGAHILPTTVPGVLALEGVDEIVWVDDGSTDETSRHLAEAARDDPRARVVTLPRNTGRSGARNAGIAASSGTVIVFLDADVEPAVGSARALAAAASLPEAVAAVARIEPVATDPSDPYQDYAVHARRGPSPDLSEGQPLDWRFFLAGASAVRRPALLRAGRFPEDIAYGEDQALACELSLVHPSGLRLAGTSVRLHDLGDLDRAVQNVEAYGRALPALRARCPAVTPRVSRGVLAVARRAGPISAGLRSVIAKGLVPVALRRQLIRYLLASHALHAASHASAPAPRLRRGDRL
ncbi:glycosyltransferase family 2 protein [Rubrivirga sp. IMCC45206]|uniref:glycosyltransferase family 2 protein n=1 Tax=Rubrivirga sp. IMCC45206 TaxID=3391614 RepID=UPI00398F9386